MKASFYILMTIILIGSAYNFNLCAQKEPNTKSRKIGLILNLLSVVLVLAALFISFFFKD